MDLITQTKQGISSLARRRTSRRQPALAHSGRARSTAGSAPRTTAWKIKTKLAEVMCLDNDTTHLDGRGEMDDAYLGGKTDRVSSGKRSIVGAVQNADGKRPARLKVRRIGRFKRKRVTSPVKRIVAPRAFVVTDGLAYFRGVADAGCEHHPIVTADGRHGAGHPSFHWLNTVLANIKTAIAATCKAVRKKHLVRTLAEFEWRFNNRENLAAMIPLFAAASTRTRPAASDASNGQLPQMG